MKEPMIRFGIAELWQPKSFELAKPDSQNLAVQSFHYVFPYVHWVINGPQNVSVITLNLYILIREIFIRLFSTDPSSSESLSIQVDRAAEAFCAVRNPKRDLLTWLESNLQSHTPSYTLHICLRFLNFDPMFVHNLWINITRTNGCYHFSPLEKSLLWYFIWHSLKSPKDTLSRDSTSRKQSLIHSTLVTLSYLLAVTVRFEIHKCQQHQEIRAMSLDWYALEFVGHILRSLSTVTIPWLPRVTTERWKRNLE